MGTLGPASGLEMRAGCAATLAQAARRRLSRPGGWRAPALALALVWCVSRALVLFPGETLLDRTLYRLTVLRDTGDVIIVRWVPAAATPGTTAPSA